MRPRNRAIDRLFYAASAPMEGWGGIVVALVCLLAMGSLCAAFCQTADIWEPQEASAPGDNPVTGTPSRYDGAAGSDPAANGGQERKIAAPRGNKTGAPAEPVVDIDGNVYQTIRIGNRVWTKTNLRTTRYNDGGPIRFIADPWDGNGEFLSLYKIGAAMFRDNAMTYAAKKNKKESAEPWFEYNWHVVKSGKLAPAGWHVPSCAEWDTLFRALESGGYDFNTVFGGGYVCDSSVSQDACREYSNNDRFWWSGDSCAENIWEDWRRKAIALRLSPGEDLMTSGPEVKTVWYPVRLVKDAKK
jgi:uncharacterized protein (TIGR02145 family)